MGISSTDAMAWPIAETAAVSAAPVSAPAAIANFADLILLTRTRYEVAFVGVPEGVMSPSEAAEPPASVIGYTVTGMVPTPSPFVGNNSISDRWIGDP